MGGRLLQRKDIPGHILTAGGYKALWHKEAGGPLVRLLAAAIGLAGLLFVAGAWLLPGWTGGIWFAVAVIICALPVSLLAVKNTARVLSLPSHLVPKDIWSGHERYVYEPGRGLGDVSAGDRQELRTLLAAIATISDEPLKDIDLDLERHHHVFTARGLRAEICAFGSSGQTYVFVTGQVDKLAASCPELWELGHVRPMKDADRSRINGSARDMRGLAPFVLGLAFFAVPKETDTGELDIDETLDNLIYLGTVSFDSRRHGRQRFTPSLINPLRLGWRAHVVSLAAGSTIITAGFLGEVMAGLPRPISLMQLLALKFLVELLPLTALWWDGKAGLRRVSGRLYEHVGSGVLIGGLAFGNYLLAYARAGFSADEVLSGSAFHAKAMAITYVTLAACVLGAIIQGRLSQGLSLRRQLQNDRFMLAVGLAILGVTLSVYGTAVSFTVLALNAADWLHIVAAAALFLALRELQIHAGGAHNRDEIIRLIRSGGQR